jgi:hypothetical protein
MVIPSDYVVSQVEEELLAHSNQQVSKHAAKCQPSIDPQPKGPPIRHLQLTQKRGLHQRKDTRKSFVLKNSLASSCHSKYQEENQLQYRPSISFGAEQNLLVER